jgi:tether containing UBX domain for GLUT4
LQKTLQQLGINNGTALLKLSYKKTEQPLEEAMTEIAEYFKEEAATKEPNDPKLAAAPAAERNIFTEAMARLSSAEPSNSENRDTDMTSQDVSERTSQDPTPYPELVGDAPLPVTPGKRTAPVSSGAEPRLEVFLPSSSHTLQATQTPHNDADYEATPAHLRSAHGRLVNNAQNQRLPSDAEIARQEEEKAAKLAAIKDVQIRIRFPDQHQVLATLQTTDTAATLYAWVKRAIVHQDQPFKLLWVPKKGGTATIPNLDSTSLVKHLGFSTRELVTFHWEEGASGTARKALVLKPELVQKGTEIKVPEVSETDTKETGNSGGIDKGKGKKVEDGGENKAKKLQNLLMKGFSKK